MPIINQIVKGSGGSAPAYYVALSLDNGLLKHSTTESNIIDFTGVTEIYSQCLNNAYLNNLAVSGVIKINDLQTTNNANILDSTFSGCTNITGFELNSFKKVQNGGNSAFYYTFNGCTGITSVSLPALEIAIATSCFYGFCYGCTGITSVNLDKLVVTNIGWNSGAFQNAFWGCSSLTNVNLSSVKVMEGGRVFSSAFRECTALTSLSFPALTTSSFGTSNKTQFQDLCWHIPNITLHFPSNVQTQVEALLGYSTTAPFGATSGTVLFDLPATVILTGANSQAYERSPKDDTGTALAWRIQDTGSGANTVIDWTPYYTNGTTDPAVGDTIYSDSACTTTVTTIDSIA